MSALALPGMVGTAHAASDDVVAGTKAQVNSLPDLDEAAAPDESQEIGLQLSRYCEGSRNLIGPVTTGTIPASPGSPITGTITGIGTLPSAAPICAEGEHAYARFRIGERVRLGVDFVQDVWSGASSTATLPASVATVAGATINGLNGYFDANGKAVYETQFQGNANPHLTGGVPQKLVYSPDTQLGHVIGYASPEARRQATFRFGYDWNEAAIDVGAGVSDELDFLSKFGNVSLRRDFNDKRTTVNLGLSFTHGDTHAEWNANGRAGSFLLDAYPGTFTQYAVPGQMVTGGGVVRLTYHSPLITGTRNDVALTGGVTQVVSRNDLFSTGFGYTHTTGFLSNPWKAAVVFFPSTPDPYVQAAYPTITAWGGNLELEHRPNLRNQFTWDSSYLHYFEGMRAAGQVHYSFFGDSWGIRAHTLDAEWRQSVGATWTVTPRLRYYTQNAADFYAPYFFAMDPTDLPKHYFSSDERLSAFGTATGGITLTKRLPHGLTAEFGVEYTLRSGSLRVGGGGDGAFADLHSYAINFGLRGSLDRPGGAAGLLGGGSDHAAHLGHHDHVETPVGVPNAHMMDEPGSIMIGYLFEQQRQGGTAMNGSHVVPFDITKNGSVITGMTMSMNMVEIMYAQSDRLNWMVMPQIVSSKMGMFMNDLNSMSMSNNVMRMRSFMASGGMGDTSVAALIKIWAGDGQQLHTAQEISIPTGSVDLREDNAARAYPFDMQPGSGTWDWKPSLTYTGAAGRWSWGGQVGGIKRLQKHNVSGYALGNEIHASAWGGYRLMPWLTGTLRSLYTAQSAISGAFANPDGTGLKIEESLPSDANPANYGGHFTDLGVGLSARLGNGAYASDKVSVEWLQPVKTDFNGTQNNRVGTLLLSARFMF